MDGYVLEEKFSLKLLGLSFSSKLDWRFCIVSITKTASTKIGALIYSKKFLSPEAALISINLPYGLTWNTVVMSELALLAATWIC